MHMRMPLPCQALQLSVVAALNAALWLLEYPLAVAAEAVGRGSDADNASSGADTLRGHHHRHTAAAWPHVLSALYYCLQVSCRLVGCTAVGPVVLVYYCTAAVHSAF